MSAAVDAFFESYRAEYERGDASAISAHFAFPLHVTSDPGEDGNAEVEVVLAHVASRDEWVSQINRLLAAYTKIGVGSARIAEQATHKLSPRLFQAVLRWELHDAHGDLLYHFDAAYTLAAIDGSLRITALAHNEQPKLLALLAHQ
ncbi:MAG TPA: hypothetical protein VFZ85_19010 [Jiangellaceae bacterium]